MINGGLELVVSFIHGVTDPIVVTDLDYKIVFVNDAAQKLFGYSLEEVKGLSPSIFNAEKRATEIQNTIYRAISTGNTYKDRALNTRKDQSTFMCEFTIIPIKSADEQIYA